MHASRGEILVAVGFENINYRESSLIFNHQILKVLLVAFWDTFGTRFWQQNFNEIDGKNVFWRFWVFIFVVKSDKSRGTKIDAGDKDRSYPTDRIWQFALQNQIIGTQGRS